MTETRWWTYLQSLMGEQTQQEAAEKIGISKSNITRWKAGARADPDFVVKAARAYGANVLEAIGAACLGRRGVMDVSAVECEL